MNALEHNIQNNATSVEKTSATALSLSALEEIRTQSYLNGINVEYNEAEAYLKATDRLDQKLCELERHLFQSSQKQLPHH